MICVYLPWLHGGAGGVVFNVLAGRCPGFFGGYSFLLDEVDCFEKYVLLRIYPDRLRLGVGRDFSFLWGGGFGDWIGNGAIGREGGLDVVWFWKRGVVWEWLVLGLGLGT